MNDDQSRPKRIVILGGGFAGVYCAQALEKKAKGLPPVEIVLISRHDYLLFYPLLIEAGTGSAESRHAVVSIRAFLKRTIFRLGEILAVNVPGREVTFRLGKEGDVQTTGFDQLVCAWGSVSNLPAIPGFSEYGYAMKSLTDAVVMRDRAIELLETADGTTDPAARRALLHFVVVGGNFTGVEVAGELNSFLRILERRFPRVSPEEIQVTLINRGHRILKEVDEDLARYAIDNMTKHRVRFRFGVTVTEIHRDHAMLTDGTMLPTHTVIWCAGIAPNPLNRKAGLPLDEKGYILCDRMLRVQGYRDVWAVGDCAINLDPQNKHYPFTAQHAVKEGVHLAKNLVRVLKGEEPEPCDIRYLGSLAMIGHHTGVAKILRWKFSGHWAWFLYRVIYLSKLPGWLRRIRVALDWTLDIFLPRDKVQLGVREPESPSKR